MIIVVILMVIAGLVLVKAGYMTPLQKDILEPTPDDEKELLPPPPPTPPESITMGYMRAVSPEDEGVHFDKLRISREWWYFTAVFDDENSELKGWTVTISFNHMAYGDLLENSGTAIKGRIIIEKGALIGSDVVIHPDVRIGEGAVVGSCSQVLEDVDPWSTNAGESEE